MTNSQTPTTDPILQEVVQKLSTYHPLRLYLFGSRARGTAAPESDYDLLLIVNDDALPQLKSAGKAYEALWGMPVPVDVVVWTQEAFDKHLHLEASFPAEVIREGKLLHVA